MKTCDRSNSQSFYINDLDGRKKNSMIINLTNVIKLKSVPTHLFGSIIMEGCCEGQKHHGISKSDLTWSQIHGHFSIHIPDSSVKSHCGHHFVTGYRQIHSVGDSRKTASTLLWGSRDIQEKGGAAKRTDTEGLGT